MAVVIQMQPARAASLLKYLDMVYIGPLGNIQGQLAWFMMNTFAYMPHMTLPLVSIFPNGN